MRNNIIQQQLLAEVYMQETTGKQNNQVAEHVLGMEAAKVALANEPEKQKAPAEKAAKLMQQIWGDKFLSDSLH